jgi:protein LTV1
LTKEALDEAVAEFIESQKLRDRKLYSKFGDEPPELVPILRKALPEEDPEKVAKEKKALIEKALARHEQLEQEYQERETSEESESDEEEQAWDCQSILSTYTNTDNHPAVIKTTARVVKTKQHMQLHKQFKVPLDGLMAEEITMEKPALKRPLVEESDSEGEEPSVPVDKAGRKKQLKEEKREKRKLKKELKLAF